MRMLRSGPDLLRLLLSSLPVPLCLCLEEPVLHGTQLFKATLRVCGLYSTARILIKHKCMLWHLQVSLLFAGGGSAA